MAIGAAELHSGASRSAANWLHVDRVIELDRAGTTHGTGGVHDQRCKFRMPVFEAANVGCVLRRTAVGPEIGMAYRAGLIADSGNINPAFVFCVALGAGEFFSAADADGVMRGPIVALETGVVGSLRGERAGFLHVTGHTFFFEDRMSLRHMPARVHALVSGKTAPRDPSQCQQRQQQAEPEFGALQRRRPLEIVEVDALREFFCCACARHFSLELEVSSVRCDFFSGGRSMLRPPEANSSLARDFWAPLEC